MPEKLIDCLSDGKVHSGVALGEALGVTRSAVAKQVAKLKEMGFQVTSVKGVGYRLHVPFDLLRAPAITDAISVLEVGFTPKVEVFWSLSSTNDFLAVGIKDSRITSSGFVCLAEHQSSGRGRRGKTWVSPLGGGLYLSLAWRFEQGAESLEGLSLSIAMGVIEVLERDFFVKNLKIKWPNDIYLNEKKLGGILIDVMGEAGGPCWAVIGIGLNVGGMGTAMINVDQPWISLSSVVEVMISRNVLAASIIESVIKKLQAHEGSGFDITNSAWKKYDAFIGKKVVVKSGDGNFFVGVSRGILKSGALVVDVDGAQRVVRSGEVSLRRV